MLKTILVLPDGTEISSGAGTVNAIQKVTLTECVNDSEELTLGSTCSNALEVRMITPAGKLAIEAGTEVVVHKENSAGVRKQIGVFILEKPTRPSANTMKFTGFDRVSKLDKDLTAWLSGLTEWPYPLTTFASMVCEVCGLKFNKTDVPNGDFLVYQFSRSSVTGRQLMRWIGEIACRFCRATATGEIELAWYTDSGVTIRSNGDRYFFSGTLAYENYTIAPVDAVQIRVTDSTEGALWPAVNAGNPYVIVGNPMLMNRITDRLLPLLQIIKEEMNKVSYTPCKVSVPASLDVRAGHTAKIVDNNEKEITICVMTKTQTGQRDTLECTGSASRASASAANTKSQRQRIAEQEAYSMAAAAAAVNAQTQQDVFNKLTDNGAVQGLYIKDGKLYINAEFVKILNLTAGLITAGRLTSTDGLTYFDLDIAEFATDDKNGTSIKLKGGRVILSAPDGNVMLVMGHNDTDAAFINFGAEKDAGSPRISVLDGQMHLKTTDADDSNALGQAVSRDYGVCWKYVNGVKVLAANT